MLFTPDPGNYAPAADLIGGSLAMRRVLELIDHAAKHRTHVFVCGEAGTGRELIARKIHQTAHGGVNGSCPFIKFDCSAADPEDIEMMLFGTSADRNGSKSLEHIDRRGQISRSKGGTLFLQNVGDLAMRAQARLARLLRDGEAAGDDGKTVALDLRVITAGDASLEAGTQDGGIRPDLFRRLAAFRLDVPPLRERRDDIPELAEHFLKMLCERASMPTKDLSGAARSMLAAMSWRRGNTTELCSLMENLVLRTTGPTISLEDVLAHVQLEAQAAWFPIGFSLRDARVRFEREYISAVLAQHHGRVPDAARTLGIQRSNLYRKMRSLNVPAKPAKQS